MSSLRPAKPKGKARKLTKSVRAFGSAFQVFDHSSALKPAIGWSGTVCGDPLGLRAGSSHSHILSMAQLIALRNRRIEVIKALSPGERWITVHPSGHEGKGVPVLVRETKQGSGVFHVID